MTDKQDYIDKTIASLDQLVTGGYLHIHGSADYSPELILQLAQQREIADKLQHLIEAGQSISYHLNSL